MPAIDAAPTVPAPATPAIPAKTTEIVAPKKAPTFEEVKRARVGSEDVTPAPVAPKVDAKKPTEVSVDITDADLDKFVVLSRENRALKLKEKDIAAKAEQAGKVEKAMQLMAEGKSVEAIAAVLGDAAFDAAATQMLALKLGGDGKVEDPTIAELKAKLAKLEETSTKTTTEIEAAAAARAKAEREDGIKKITAEIASAPDQFPYLAEKPERIAVALRDADEAYELWKKDTGAKEKRDMTSEEKNRLLVYALEEAEDAHAARAKEYGATPKTRKAAGKPTETPKTFGGGQRGSIRPKAPVTGKKSFEEVRKARLSSGN